MLSVRGRGLLLGIEVDGAAADVVDAAREHGLLVLTAGENVVRLAPPLTVTARGGRRRLSRFSTAYSASVPHTMNRRERQNAILELVRERALSTQAEVASALKESGFEVVQTTVSRDIADLGLVKVRAPSGRLVYAPPGSTDGDRLRALGAAMRRYAITVEAAGTLVVVTTPSGYANALAQAIDEAAHPAIAGTIAGDNTIFVAARDGISAQSLARRAGRLPAPGRGMSGTAVVAYSGGLDTSCILAWLKEDWYGFDEVVAVLVDVGQEFDLEESIARANAAGADDVLLVDRKDAFADEQCARAILTNALYEGKYPLVSALSRPVIAQAVAEIALEIGAEAVVHGCTGKGNDQLRFELAFKAHYPGVKVIAPLRDRIWTRDEEIEYALAKGIPVVQTAASPFSIDENLFGRAIEAGVLEDPWNAPPEEPYALTSDPASAPAPIEIVVGFEKGIPVSLDGEELSLAELIAQVNRLAGAYGIGRIDMIENRAVGIKSREVYEAPGAMTLIAAHSALEDVVLTKDEARLKRPLEQRWTEIVYEGRWFSPAREAIDAFVDSTQELVTGEVRVELRPNAAVVTGRRSPHMIYAAELASYGTGETFPHDAAEGFIRISSLETELARRESARASRA